MKKMRLMIIASLLVISSGCFPVFVPVHDGHEGHEHHGRYHDRGGYYEGRR